MGKVYKMKIGNRTESDHRPIEVLLGKIIIRRKLQEEGRREIEDWSEKGSREYKQKLKKRVESTNGAKEEWEELVKEIRKAVPKKRIKRREMVPGRRTWWDAEKVRQN